MSVSWPEQQRREREHLCIMCAKPCRWLERHDRYGVHCEKCAQRNNENYKKWKARTGPRKKS